MRSDSLAHYEEFASAAHRRARRLLLEALALSALPCWAQVTTPKRMPRIGWMTLRESIFKEPYSQAFVARLAELGFVEGTTLVIDRLDAGDSIERMPETVRKLAEKRPDVLFSAGGEGAFVALKKENQGIPSVFVSVDFDPVQAGHVDKMARPGGSMTGVSGNQGQLPAKRLELLKLLLPKARKVAVFNNPQSMGQLIVAKAAAEVLGLTLEVIEFKAPPFNYEAAFEAVVRARADALLVLGSSLFVAARQKIPQLAMAHRVPAVFHQAQWADAGGLMSYGYSFPSMWRTGADMTVKALRGVPIAEIPMEFPTTYELVINATTAKLLGVEVPYELKLRADRIIS